MTNNTSFFGIDPLFLILALLAIAAVIGLMLWLVWKAARWLRTEEGERLAEKLPFAVQEFLDDVPFLRGKLELHAQSEGWREAMAMSGKKMRRAGVRGIFFAHGTFLGDDPFGIVHFLQANYPRFFARHEPQLRRMVRGTTNRFAKDSANFSPHYVRLYQSALGDGIACEEVVWSSENHHMGRLRGMRALVIRLAKFARDEKLGDGDRVLLIGHSHAGQLFALLSLCLTSLPKIHPIMVIAFGEDGARNLQADLETISRIRFDIVTFGTPIRYPWGLGEGLRVLHVVNHRGDAPWGTDLRGMFTTAGGDYIHRMGVIGSDLLATHKDDREKNRLLDQYLGKGIDPLQWARLFRQSARVAEHGDTILVDYKDNSRLVPNATFSVFGHAIYTRFQAMLFNTRLIVDYFYK